MHNVAAHQNETIPFPANLLDKVRRISKEVLQPAAASVDHEARFPHEAIEALRQERLLGAYIPKEYGGLGCTVAELAAMAEILAASCASTAMIWSMHQIQLAMIVNHELASPFFQHYLREAADQQFLIASVTSEVGVGGDVRTSIAHVQATEEGCRLEKKSSAISYGAYADAFLITGRRAENAAASDQVLVLLHKRETYLKQTGNWNVLGMRGTCSPSFEIASTFPAEQICTTAFADISTQSMVPFAHLLWSSCWVGIATNALERARKFLQGKARHMRTSSVPGDSHLVEATGLLQLMRANLQDGIQEYTRLLQQEDESRDALYDMGFAIKLNNIKLLSSRLVVQIVQEALQICGMAGYSEESPFSVARHLRDAYSASLMINNERLQTTTAAMLLIHKEGKGR